MAYTVFPLRLYRSSRITQMNEFVARTFYTSNIILRCAFQAQTTQSRAFVHIEWVKMGFPAINYL